MHNMSHKPAAVSNSSAYFFAVCMFGDNFGSGAGIDIQTSTAYSIPSGFTLVTTATWDASHNGTGNIISNSNLSIKNLTTNNTAVTTYDIKTNDKVIMSFKYVHTRNWQAPDNAIFGIAKQSIYTSTGQWPGSGGRIPANYGAGIYDDGQTLITDSVSTRWATTTRKARIYAPNDILDVAVDQANKRMWFRVNGNPWMATYATPTVSVGADPATNAGGFDVSGLTGL